MNKAIIKCPHCAKSNRVPAAADGRPRCGNCHRELPWVVEAGDDDFGEIAERSGVPALVDFWAVWCGPCRMVSPVLDQLAHERPGQIKLVKVDVDHSPQLSTRFAIQAVPTLMVIVDGKIVARQAGAAPAPVLRSWLEGALAK
ncbi:thioredoxin [Arthrobacter sp. EPSL27]|uniref:thioredoxin n=1 Tax=Arthrobacter sp. EPSL27 TaxID=1745378 RepID=UPI00074A5F0A|nr:thioredoxin [Arthrobacter sp. EPSL27]KUM33257.1 thioredoxin [Arthrobacter sp. EPSL27]